ncbi:hypothetical protein [Paraliobacillus salinarum]|uniref:hypothetical protein n=1 Tax=Paraliobacillus salinarum TaxID=1158996 RepID=UPI0015F4A012|nr:hypothetical protein [Paraliobacillus salinarum]
MRTVIRILSFLILIFLLYNLFSENRFSDWVILIAAFSSFVLFFLSKKLKRK